MAEYRKIVCLDFDGVLHKFDSPWTNPHTIPDGSVPYAMEFVLKCLVMFDVHIFSSRSKTWRGRRAMKKWMLEQMYKSIGDTPAPQQQQLPAKLIGEHWDNAAPYDNNMRVIAKMVVGMIYFPTTKPPAHVTLDDRAILFEGRFPHPEWIANFNPWNKHKRTAATETQEPVAG
jgi:hypothetical protein